MRGWLCDGGAEGHLPQKGRGFRWGKALCYDREDEGSARFGRLGFRYDFGGSQLASDFHHKKP